jgi:uncharacterized delta-60 repeat protein
MKKKISSILLFTLLTSFSYSQLNSDIDPSFHFSTNSANENVRNITKQQDNKLLIAGFLNGDEIKRLNIDGSIDNSFELSNKTDIYQIYTTTLNNENKILVGGERIRVNQWNTGWIDKRIVMLKSDGNLDTSFNDNGIGFNNTTLIIKIQNDGKILVGGKFTSYNDITHNRIIRLNSNGSIDETFDIGTGFDDTVKSIEIQSDNKILIGGDFKKFNGINKRYLIRLNSDGTIDNNFFIGSGPNGSVSCIKIQNNNKILIGGEFTSFKNAAFNHLIRLELSGSTDVSFDIGEGFSHSSGLSYNQLEIISITEFLGNIYVTGNFEKYDNNESFDFVKIKENGKIDKSFDIGVGFRSNYLESRVHSLIFDTNRKLLLGGNFQFYNRVKKDFVLRLFGENNTLSLENFYSNKLQIFPNPVLDKINIYNSNLEQKENLYYEIYSVTGKKIKSAKFSNSVIDVDDLLKGYYIIKLKNDNKILYNKFLKL